MMFVLTLPQIVTPPMWYCGFWVGFGAVFLWPIAILLYLLWKKP